MADCLRLVSSRTFGSNLTRLHFYLSEQLTDEILSSIAEHNHVLEEITIIDCQNTTDKVSQLICGVEMKFSIVIPQSSSLFKMLERNKI